MTQRNDGGPAFPRAGFSGPAGYGKPTDGMTLRQYAAIKLRVPDSGEEWLDDMIRQANRDDFAGQALTNVNANDIYEAARFSYETADALLAEYERRDIEWFGPGGWNTTKVFRRDPSTAYRVKPEPVREVVSIRGGFYRSGLGCESKGWDFGNTWMIQGGHNHKPTHRITFDLIDGKPDCKKCPHCGTAPVDMEPLG